MKGMEHALRSILDAGGDIRKKWNLQNALAAGDRGVGVSVLRPLYAKMKEMPVRVDLITLWTELGIHSDATSIRFDDSATLAAIRRAITTAECNSVSGRFSPTTPSGVLVVRAFGPSVFASGEVNCESR